jgi:uncharacterized protein
MANVAYKVPGVYRQDVFPQPAPSFVIGVPVFLGYATDGPAIPQRLNLWPQFEAAFQAAPGSYLPYAVRGFFENDGLICYVLRLDNDLSPRDALRSGLERVRDLEDVDLICAPDMTHGIADLEQKVAQVALLQREVLDFCQTQQNCFAILDTAPTVDLAKKIQTQAPLTSDYGALYYPWLYLGLRPDKQPLYVPSCGHVAGIYSRTDQRTGMHKAPANEEIAGVLDLQTNLNAAEVGELYANGVNCLQALPGRGIRVWGARTLSSSESPSNWPYVNVRRTFIAVHRWVAQFMADLVHEPNDVRLWVRIMRELTAFLDGLFQRGAFKGRTAAEAFYVKCDGETNSPEAREAGMVVTQIGLALAAPAEFIEVRIIHGASGVTVQASS